MEKLLVGLKAPHDISGICISIDEKQWTYKENLNLWLKDHFHFPSNASFVCYNDAVPDGFDSFSDSCSYAHSKGVLIWTDTQLFWLIHSVPKWPHIGNDHLLEKPVTWWDRLKNLYSCFRRSCCCSCLPDSSRKITLPDIPNGETKYGQSFVFLQMYISGEDLVENILKQLLFMNVQMYHFQGILKEKINMLKKETLTFEKHKLSVLEITSTVKHCAKSHFHHADFYESLVHLTKVEKCLVESWMRPAMEESSTVQHIQMLEWKDDNENTFHMKESSDHSKWAISQGGKKPWVLVGDLNRMTSQLKRGGGGLLVENCRNLHSLLEDLVLTNL
jgi:deoxyribonuclease-2